MIQKNERTKPRTATNPAARGLVVVSMILGAAALFPAPQAQAKDVGATQTFQHTYDEVFQASLDAIERMGLFLTAQDKGMGTISGNGTYQLVLLNGHPATCQMTFDIQIKTLSAKPEVQVAINTEAKHCWGGYLKRFNEKYLSEIPKVLSTYH